MAAITFAFGFWQYICSFRLVRREGKGPFPVWMHTFYFAHGSSWAIMMAFAAARSNWNPFLLATSFALVVWTLFEIYNLVQVVRLERDEMFSRYFGQQVTQEQAIIAILVQIIVFLAVINILVQFMGNGSLLQTGALTNMVMAAGPAMLWFQRRSREGSGLGIALVILFGTINTFLPFGLFVLAIPEVFDSPYYYLTGVIFTAIALTNVVMQASLPAKLPSVDGRKPIW